MNAVQRNAFTDGWRRTAASILKPRAILAVSAHWYLPATAVTISQPPKTIHDFGGFPAELFRVQYPAPGDEWLARRVRALLHPYKVDFADDWGLDHGTWSVLRHAYPDADVPVVQLSINEAHAASFHFQLGQQLAPLRSEGVLVVGSGNIVHNLEAYAWGRHVPNPYDWAERFEGAVKRSILSGDFKPLIIYHLRSHVTPKSFERRCDLALITDINAKGLGFTTDLGRKSARFAILSIDEANPPAIFCEESRGSRSDTRARAGYEN